ncbi:MAG: hypothetical protein OXC57_01675 [Rhodobacteraceae bacterium]|nr:hypothetical protein [Paracoccaceae bacterium]
MVEIDRRETDNDNREGHGMAKAASNDQSCRNMRFIPQDCFFISFTG